MAKAGRSTRLLRVLGVKGIFDRRRKAAIQEQRTDEQVDPPHNDVHAESET